MRWASACVALILAVGITASVIALGGREANSEFVAQQRALAPVSAAALQQLIATTSDPRPGYGGRALRRALQHAEHERARQPVDVRGPLSPPAARALPRDRRRQPLDPRLGCSRGGSAARCADGERVLRGLVLSRRAAAPRPVHRSSVRSLASAR